MTCMEPDWPRPNRTTAPAPTPERRRTPPPERRCTGGARALRRWGAHAHTEENVIVKENEAEEEPDGINHSLRSRPESTPATQPEIDPIPALQAPKLESVVPDRPEPSESILMPQEAPMALSKPVAGPTLTAAVQALPVADLAAPASRGPTVLPLDLGAIGKPMTSFSMPPRVTTPPVPRPPFQRKKLGSGPSRAWPRSPGMTRSWRPSWPAAQRPRHRPSRHQQTLPTVELFEMLPGRHDLIMIAARRLSEETGDFKVVSQRTFEQMAEAVATRAVPPAVLIIVGVRGWVRSRSTRGRCWWRPGSGRWRRHRCAARRRVSVIEGARRTGCTPCRSTLGRVSPCPGPGRDRPRWD